MQGPADAVCGLVHDDVGLALGAVVGQLGVANRGEHAGERLAVTVAAPSFAAGGKARGGAGRVGVGAPGRGGEEGQLFCQS